MNLKLLYCSKWIAFVITIVLVVKVDYFLHNLIVVKLEGTPFWDTLFVISLAVIILSFIFLLFGDKHEHNPQERTNY